MSGEIRVQLDRAHLAARMEKGKEFGGKALAEQILGDCTQYSVPDDGEHMLKSSGRVEKVDGDDYAATWNTVYAAYQFYGCWPDGSHKIHDGPPIYNDKGKKIRGHTQSYTENPHTQWTETARDRFKADWDKQIQKKFVEGADG